MRRGVRCRLCRLTRDAAKLARLRKDPSGTASPPPGTRPLFPPQTSLVSPSTRTSLFVSRSASAREKNAYRIMSRRCEPWHEGRHVFHLGNKESAFGDLKEFDRHISDNVELTAKDATSNIGVGPSETCQVFKVLGCYEVADFFMNFPDRALKESLFALAMTAKQADLAREKDAGNVVSLLKKKTPARIDDKGGSNFPALRRSHDSLYLMFSGTGPMHSVAIATAPLAAGHLSCARWSPWRSRPKDQPKGSVNLREWTDLPTAKVCFRPTDGLHSITSSARARQGAKGPRRLCIDHKPEQCRLLERQI